MVAGWKTANNLVKKEEIQIGNYSFTLMATKRAAGREKSHHGLLG
jgi:hypothetical protein